jgi:hypothetical protein
MMNERWVHIHVPVYVRARLDEAGQIVEVDGAFIGDTHPPLGGDVWDEDSQIWFRDPALYEGADGLIEDALRFVERAPK